MKNAVVFGATGQLGCYSALALKDNGYNVYAVGRRKEDNGFFKQKGFLLLVELMYQINQHLRNYQKRKLMWS